MTSAEVLYWYWLNVPANDNQVADMNKRTHKEQIVALLQEILAQPNARYAAQHKLYTLKASLLTKGK